MKLELGLKGRAQVTVSQSNTAQAAGSGSLEVYATPSLVALMEKAACDSLQKTLEPGKTSVGTVINVQHSSATPLGLQVYAESVVTAIYGKKVCFHVTAYDEIGEIGSGEHERYIVDEQRFMERCTQKLLDGGKSV